MGVWDPLRRYAGEEASEAIDEMCYVLEEYRMNGFGDAVNHLATELATLDNEYLESMRLDAYRNRKETYAKIQKSVEFAIDSLERSLSFKNIRIGCIFACILFLLVSSSYLVVLIATLIFVIPLTLHNILWKYVLYKKVIRQYYEHGYLEAIEDLCDRTGRFTETLDISAEL